LVRANPISIAILLAAAPLIIAAGCVVNFKDEHKKKGIIHVDIHYVYPGKNELNTFRMSDHPAGTYKKEIAIGRYAETKIELDPGQQLLVLNQALVLHFFQMPDTFYHAGASGEKESPAERAGLVPTQSMRIQADTLNKTIYWHGSLDALRPENYHVRELVEYVDSIVRSTEEYQGLPKSTITEH